MPKIIADLEENILKEARRVLLESGYDALTMRAVASGCGIAVGTVYNYFASKELLCARVMLRDWQQALDGMCEDISSAPDALLGLRCILCASTPSAGSFPPHGRNTPKPGMLRR